LALDNSQMNPFSVGNWCTCTKTTVLPGYVLIIKIPWPKADT